MSMESDIHGRVKGLSGKDMKNLLMSILQEMYYDSEYGKWNLDKEWSPSTLDEISFHLDAYGLVPHE